MVCATKSRQFAGRELQESSGEASARTAAQPDVLGVEASFMKAAGNADLSSQMLTMPQFQSEQVPKDLTVVSEVALTVKLGEPVDELGSEVTALSCLGISQDVAGHGLK